MFTLAAGRGLMVPDEVSFPFTVDAFVTGNTQDGDSAFVRRYTILLQGYQRKVKRENLILRVW